MLATRLSFKCQPFAKAFWTSDAERNNSGSHSKCRVRYATCGHGTLRADGAVTWSGGLLRLPCPRPRDEIQIPASAFAPLQERMAAALFRAETTLGCRRCSMADPLVLDFGPPRAAVPRAPDDDGRVGEMFQVAAGGHPRRPEHDGNLGGRKVLSGRAEDRDDRVQGLPAHTLGQTVRVASTQSGQHEVDVLL